MLPCATEQNVRNSGRNSNVSLLTRTTIQLHVPPSPIPQFIRGQRPDTKVLQGIIINRVGVYVFCFPNKRAQILFKINATVFIKGNGRQFILQVNHLSDELKFQIPRPLIPD